MVEENDKRAKGIKQNQQEIVEEKQKLLEKIENSRAKFQELQDEFMQKKLEDGRELALFQQKHEFQDRKIEDVQKREEEMISKYDERLQQSKSDHQ